MLKANLKNALFITLLTTLTFLVGCSSPEEKKAAKIESALNLSAEGKYPEAIKILEELSIQYPNDIEILDSMGRIYTAQGDATMAAFFMEQAYLKAPENTELLYQTYQMLEAANQPAGHLLEKLATQAPEVMTPELWVRLGQIRQAENEVQPALDAYLKGVDPEQQKPTSETAAAIGQLFVKAGNLPQAERWLEIAADSDDPNALTALFGLLEINLRQKDWAGAEATINQLDKQFPGAVEASEWQQARQELTRWRQAQDAMKAKLAQAEADKKAAEAKAAAAEALAKAEAAQAKKAQEATQTPTIQSKQASSNAVTHSDESGAVDDLIEVVDTGSKAQIIADLEAAEAMADTPAIEDFELPVTNLDGNNSLASTTTDESSKAITFDPNIAIEPADPEITFEVNYDQEALAKETSYAVEQSDLAQAPTQIEAAPTMNPALDPAPQYQAPQPSVLPSSGPRSIEELLADAETATLDRDFKSAIRKYWAAISIENNRPEVWNLLSRAYLVDGQLNNAETAALEAVRLQPREVAYTLDYLRVAQRSKEPAAFLAELETAYDRFPSSPEITLSLARGHERISHDTATARNLYLRFIDLAPNHPLIPEARAAVSRL
jgi:cytochrome c-type biogenesis protein CcmH/NrfG